MPSRYNQLLPEQQYVSSYIPLPLDLMMKSGQMKQGEHDKQLEDTYKMEDLMKSVNAIDEHKPFKRQLENKYLGQINDVADQIQKTGTSDPGQIRRIARNWENDPLRQELETSYANRQLEQKKKIELGDKYAPWGDPNAGFQGIDNSGNIQPLRFSGFHERQDHQKKAEDMMNGLKPSGEDAKVFNIDPNTGDILSVKKGYEGIASNWVKKVANLKTKDFINTIEGGDFVRQFTAQNGRQPNQSDVANYLYNAGANQISGKSTNEQELQRAPEYLHKEGKPSMIFDEKTPIVDLAKNAFDTDKLVKKDRSASFPGQFTGSMGAYTPGASGEQIKDANNKKVDYGTLTEQEKKIYDGISKNIFPGITNKDELNSKIKTYLDNINGKQVSTFAESIPDDVTYPYSGDKKGAEGLTHSVFGGDKVSDVGSTGHYINRNFYDPESGKTLSGTQFYDNVLKNSDKNAPIQVTNQFSNKNPFTVLTGDDKFARSYQIVVGNKQYIMSGADKEIIRTKQGDIDQSANDRFINKISRIQYSPDKQGEIDVPIRIGDKSKYSKAEVKINSDGLWEMNIPEISAKFTGGTEEELRDAYSEYFKEKK